MGIFDRPVQPPSPPRPEQAQVAPVSPDAAEWFRGGEIAKGIAQGEAEALRRRGQTGGDPVPPPPPGEHRGR